MWRQLIWKEWREQRWRLAFGCVLFGGFALIGLSTRMMPDADVIILALIFGAPLMALLASMAPLAGEREEGTLPMLLALPVAPWKILLVKTLMAAAVCLAPLAAVLLVALVVAGNREGTTSELLLGHGLAAAFALMLLVWSLALGARMATEARAALVAIAIVALWAISFYVHVLVLYPFLRDSGNRALLALGMVHPLGVFYIPAETLWAFALWIAVHATVMTALWFWAARRWTRLGGRAA
ncbi:MAG: ABC transporter permease subunit [Phycisphaerae bacterium]|nr:ABC transporter permease subunit [Phycisphaerae bacterium]